MEDDLYAVIINDHIYESYLTITEANDIIDQLGCGNLILMTELDA